MSARIKLASARNWCAGGGIELESAGILGETSGNERVSAGKLREGLRIWRMTTGISDDTVRIVPCGARKVGRAQTYTVYMPRIAKESAVLTIRVTPTLSRRLDREARRQRLTRSEAARAILETALEGRPADDLAEEARRQSELAAKSTADAETLKFIAAVADTRGWK